MTRHEFLRALHVLLQPRFYLEIGVQYGESLRLASCPSIGIDPAPYVAQDIPNARIVPTTSNEFFANRLARIPNDIDLAFIDGSHLAEDALQDFLNIEQFANTRTVIVFDDVLPYNKEIATRVQPPGDWTGDVWKVYYWLINNRAAPRIELVDTFPTGTLVVWDLYDFRPQWRDPVDFGEFQWDMDPPDEIIGRHKAISPYAVLEQLSEWKEAW